MLIASVKPLFLQLLTLALGSAHSLAKLFRAWGAVQMKFLLNELYNSYQYLTRNCLKAILLARLLILYWVFLQFLFFALCNE